MCAEEMGKAEVERFLCCARVGRLGVALEDEKPLFMEILKASKIVPLMVEDLAKKEVVIA